MKLRKLLTEIADSATYIAHQVEDATRERYLQHYHVTDQEGNKVLVPKEYAFSLDGESISLVPEASLVNPVTPRLEKFTIKAETDVTHDREGNLEMGLTRGLFKKKAHVEISATFSVGDGAEGLHVIQDKLHDRMRGKFKLKPKVGEENE